MAAFSGLSSLLWSRRAQGSEGRAGLRVQFTGRLRLSIVACYAIERAIKEEIAKTAPEDKADESERAAIRLRIRQEKAVPVLERFREWLEAQKPDALPKSPFGIAIGYVQNNWEALTRYTTSGYLSIDNNVSELGTDPQGQLSKREHGRRRRSPRGEG